MSRANRTRVTGGATASGDRSPPVAESSHRLQTGRTLKAHRLQTGATPCERADLADWSVRGGPLPRSLAVHVRECDACAERIRRVGEVHASLMLLRTQMLPPALCRRTHRRSLRWLETAARRSSQARRLLTMRPNLSPWQRAQLHLTRVSFGAAAAMLMLVARSGVQSGLEQAREAGEQLASVHWERHIDPDNEWLEPPHFA